MPYDGRSLIDREAVQLPVILGMSQAHGRGADGPGIRKPGDEDIRDIVCLLSPQEIVIPVMVQVCVIQ